MWEWLIIVAVSKPFNYDFPYPSQRMPVLAERCVATSQPLAAPAGLGIIEQGGNAIDAAIATAAALTVLEPTSNGIGGDNFALIWSGGELHGLNASGRSAKRLDPTPFEQSGKIPRHGWEGVTVPGAVSGWVAAHTRFGRLPFEQVHLLDIDNGARLETYVIEGERGSREICVNGAAAHLIHRGDTLIIVSYETLSEDEAKRHEPKLVYVDESNNIVRTGHAIETSALGSA